MTIVLNSVVGRKWMSGCITMLARMIAAPPASSQPTKDSCSTTGILCRLAAGWRGGDHPGQHRDAPRHPFPSDDAVQHNCHARPAVPSYLSRISVIDRCGPALSSSERTKECHEVRFLL